METPDGEIVGLTSAHFLDGADSALLEGDWIEIDSGKVRGAFNRSLGMPGHKPTGPDEFDRDYVVLTDDTPVFDVPTLTLDSRTLPAIGERIWMPNKDATSPDGYRLVAGTVSQTTVDYVVVNLDKPVVPQSQSGSPFISQTTGKIIGIWCATPKDRAGSQILLTPAAAIGKAIADAQTRPLLSEVIGKAK